MSTAVVLFTRDLRVHDNPTLAAAAGAAEHVVPLFVHDDAVRAAGFAAPARSRFLADSLADLDRSLRAAGAHLVVREGDVVEQVCRVADEVDADEVHLSADVSEYARRREARLADALRRRRRALRTHEEVVTVVAPGAITPSGAGKDHFAVFTPYFRRWSQAARREVATAPRRLRLPPGLRRSDRAIEASESWTWAGGEREGLRRADRWFEEQAGGYHRRHDDLAADATSRLSPYLHFGCLSPLDLTIRRPEGSGEGVEAFVRQLAWRDFHHQVLSARPAAAREDYRSRGDDWRDDEQGLQAWREGCTGVPIVDAGMRQLRAEGWMHNRARLITGSFLTKTLYLDWRAGAGHFFDHLVDGDVANNCMNWQWVAGTGTDTRPNRVLNPVRQAERYDPEGEYVRRWVPELDGLESRDVHRPWRLGSDALRRLGYPAPVVDLDEARARFQAARGR